MPVITYRQALNQAIDEEMARDERVFLIGEEVALYNGAYKVSRGLYDKYGERRIIDTPISEEGFTGIGIGAAMAGLRPIVEWMTFNFSIQALDQVINNAAKMRYMSGGQFHLPIVFRGPNGPAEWLSAQHSQALAAIYAHVPGLKVISAATPYDAKGLLKSAIRDDNPVVMMEAELLYGLKGDVPGDEYLIPIGAADIKRQGCDVTLITFGKVVHMVLKAAEALAEDGIAAEVIDLRSLRPLDADAVIQSVSKTSRCVVIDESWPVASVGSYVAHLVSTKCFDLLDAQVELVAAEDVPMPYNHQLELAAQPSVDKIVAAVEKVMYAKPQFCKSRVRNESMAEKVLMLALSPTMEEGVIVKWIKSEGDSVEQGDILCEIETDKATMEYESPAEGILLKIIAGEGQAVPVGGDIAIIGRPGEDVSALIEEAPAPAEKAPVEKARPVRKEPQVVVPAAEGKLRSSPSARKLARERGIDLSTVHGSGPQGRITRSDVETAASGAVSHPPPQVAGLTDQTVPVTQKRKVIADTLSRSKFTAPHYYLRVTAAVDNLMQARSRLNDKIGRKISVNAFLMKFVAETLKRHPMINATWRDDAIVMHGTADIALAVAQPDGLIAPVVRDCGAKGVLRIDRELKTLIEKTRKGSLTRADYADSTFTVSSLGTFGIEEFTAIINPPNSAILAVGEIMKMPVAGDDDRIGIGRCMKLTLSCDHRIIDGTVGAAFLGDLKEMIEYPVHDLY